MEALRSEKGKHLGHLDDFLYWKHSSRGINSYWRCIFYESGADGETSSKCRGRAVSSGTEATMTQKHNHFGDRAA
uniref:FLYWCH-type domain-containing protein n=1 Tax=Ditylenchus dipsaci TaxID=166011 RepID=A0A915E8W9_9BILA